jgi:hypothetical protein
MSDIRILKGGQTGHGVLIEHDAGYIDPEEKRNQPFINEMKKLAKGETIMEEPLVLYVVLQKFGVKNRNGRIYPEHILKREADKYKNELVNTASAMGELDHPESSVISGGNVSHNIIDVWWEGKTLMGKIEINTTPGFINMGICSTSGDQVANLLRKGWRVGVSSRGVGSLEEVGGDLLVQDDFEIICWDVVLTPSTPGSYMFNKKEEAAPFMESKKHDKSLLTNKLNKYLLD